MNDKMIKRIMMIVGFCIYSINLYAINVAQTIKEHCNVDFNVLADNPLSAANEWVDAAKGQMIHTTLATIWEDHPAVRRTDLEKITQEDISFHTLSNFNMVKHFKKNNHVAIDILINNKNGCIQQIRAEGVITKSTMTNETVTYTKTGKSEKSLFGIYTIKPNWVQLGVVLTSASPMYVDKEYLWKDNQWKKDGIRTIEHDLGDLTKLHE